MAQTKTRNSLFNRDALWSTVWSTIQQLVVASSTYFILEAIRAATSGNLAQAFKLIFAFVASLVLVYLPNTISMLYLQRWRLSSIENYIRSFVTSNYGKTTRGHARNKQHIESLLTNEVFTVYDEATNLLYQLYSTLTNSLFNVVVIAIALDARLIAWYVGAGFVLMAANRISRGQIRIVASTVQLRRKELSNTMLISWDNIFSGNSHNFNNWNAKLTSGIAENKRAASRYDVVRSVISGLTVSIALLIVAVGNGIFLYESRENLSLVAALFITLPRQLQIIQSVFSFFNLTLSWAGVATQLEELGKPLEPIADDQNSSQYVQFSKISLTCGDHSLVAQDLADVISNIGRHQAGRWTMRGHNGAGKSTLLSLLKESLAGDAFLLPSHYSGLAFSADFLSHSDGNRLLSVFAEIARLEDVKFILLDEWDANLDANNLRLVHEAIDRLALSKVVIESRHRATDEV